MTTDLSDYMDGNALAGPLSELFVVDVTTATTTCVGCGRQSHVAELRLYATGPGMVARCPGCQDPVVRYVRTPSAAVLDLRGTVRLSVPMPG
jgi:hypothetical protein